MLAASSVGMISRLASPFRREFGNAPHAHLLGQRGVAVHLAFDLELGIHRVDQRRARPASSSPADASLVPKLECDSSATLGAMPKRRISSAARMRDLGELLGGGVGVDVGVGDEHGARRAASPRSSPRTCARPGAGRSPGRCSAGAARACRTCRTACRRPRRGGSSSRRSASAAAHLDLARAPATRRAAR